MSDQDKPVCERCIELESANKLLFQALERERESMEFYYLAWKAEKQKHAYLMMEFERARVPNNGLAQ